MNEELSGIEKELADILAAEKQQNSEDTIEAVEEPEAQEQEDAEAAEPQPEPENPEPVAPEEPKVATPDVYFKLREAAREREKLEKELAELKTVSKAAIPSPDEDIEGHLKGELEQVKETLNNVLGVVGQDLLAKKEEQELESAFSILGQYEKNLAAEKPDYEQARNHLAKIYAEEYKLNNPKITDKQLIQSVAKEIIKVADFAAENGKDPAAFIYDRASLYGYRPEVKQEVKPEPRKTPDLSKVAANKERSAGMAAGAGSGATNTLTWEVLERMSTEERAKLTESDWKRLG